MITNQDLFTILETLSNRSFGGALKLAALSRAVPLDHLAIEKLLSEIDAINGAYEVVKKILDRELPEERDIFAARVKQ